MSELNNIELPPLTRHLKNRVCKVCLVMKPIEEYHRHPSRPNSVKKTCKTCYNAHIAVIRRRWTSSGAEKKREYDRKNRERHPEKWMWKRTKTRAKKDNIAFDIEISDITIPKFCPVLGIELKPGKGCKQDSSPSIDRIDHTKGYTKGNIIVISLKANQLKSNGTIEEHEKLLCWMKTMNCN